MGAALYGEAVLEMDAQKPSSNIQKKVDHY